MLNLLIICHRGNLNGPSPETENTIESIHQCFEKKFDVEIDVWKIDDKLFLGHDGPMNEITNEFLYEHRNQLWIHCKNIEAAEYCCHHNLRWFGHDVDDYVSVFKSPFIWRHPNSLSKINKKCILVMPELSRLSIEDIKNCYGVCTDYPYHYLNPNVYHILYLPVYDLMKHNHELKLSIKNSFIEDIFNYKKNCLAIWSWLDQSEFNSSFFEFLDFIASMNIGIPYCLKKNEKKGRIHFTLMQCISFDQFESEFNLDSFHKSKSFIHQQIDPLDFEIEWKEIILIQNGIVMVGIPTIDINHIRNKIIQHLKFKEPYLNNIIHSTLLRFDRELDKSELEILKLKIKDIKNFGNSKINRFYYDVASLLMNDK